MTRATKQGEALEHEEAPLTKWDWLRALLVSIALVGHLIAALPATSPLGPMEAASPMTQEELSRWRELAGSIGLATSNAELMSAGQKGATTWTKLHRALRKPFRPLFSLTNTGQAWGFFAMPPTHPGRLEIWGRREGGEWQLFFRRLDPEHDELASVFSFRRIRGIYDGPRHRLTRRYRNFARWASRVMFHRHPDLSEVRVQIVPLHTSLPGESSDPSGAPTLVRIHKKPTLPEGF